ncbi:MAG: hypothetical protein R2758_04220 [Bacteroidales bacterium]
MYSWDNAASLSDATAKSPTAKPAVNTTYTVTVTDANGCSVTATVTINVAPPLMAWQLWMMTRYRCMSHLGGSSAPPSAAPAKADTPTCGTIQPRWMTRRGQSCCEACSINTLHGHRYRCQRLPDNSTGAGQHVAQFLPLQPADDNIIGACPTSVANLTATGAGGELLLSGDYTYNWSPATGVSITPMSESGCQARSNHNLYCHQPHDGNGCTASAR